MSLLLDWLWAVPGHRLVPLFDADAGRVVRTKESGPDRKRLLCRSAAMEAAVIEMVEPGLQQADWHGLLYVMGWGAGASFRPLYVGKAEKRGVKQDLSGNLANIRRNKGKFARWGDGLDYHVGDLSHAMYEFQAYRQPNKKYRRWADRLFESFDPPTLREPVHLYLAGWLDGSSGPSGLVGSLPAAEKEVIALASAQFPDSLLNVDGV